MSTDLLLQYLESLHKEYGQMTHGEVASYIPELSKADPEWFGIAIVTVDGHSYQVGDTQQTFTIQSISKLVTYGIGLEDYGIEPVLQKINVEPSGEAFNSISLEPKTGRPKNPMINAGAIAATVFVAGDTLENKLQRILDTYQCYLGHEVAIDEEVYLSEKSTGHRNFAIAYMLRNYDIIESDPDSLLDLYFKQCSVLVNCRDLALIAATLANDGVNPLTGVRAIKSEYVPKVLSIMSSCGMYDASGAWIYEIGMPAKSGVAGGILAVLPGQLGIGVFSPRLDERGNSVRGIAVCKRISSDFSLHMFHTGRTTAASVIHVTYNASNVTSKRMRNSAQSEFLSQQGHKIVASELQGDLMFASAEIVATQTMQAARNADYLILDFQRISSVDNGAMHLLSRLIAALNAQGKTVLLTNVKYVRALEKIIKHRVPDYRNLPLLKYKDIDDALEWCEDQLLAELISHSPDEEPLSAQVFCDGFTQDELVYFESFLEPRTYSKGAHVCRIGEPATDLFFIQSGQVSVLVPGDTRRGRRITSFSAGSAFGEMALFDYRVRSADVVADTDITCLLLNFEHLSQDSSELGTRIQLKLVTNIGRELAHKLRQATMEIKSLKS